MCVLVHLHCCCHTEKTNFTGAAALQHCSSQRASAMCIIFIVATCNKPTPAPTYISACILQAYLTTLGFFNYILHLIFFLGSRFGFRSFLFYFLESSHVSPHMLIIRHLSKLPVLHATKQPSMQPTKQITKTTNELATKPMKPHKSQQACHQASA